MTQIFQQKRSRLTLSGSVHMSEVCGWRSIFKVIFPYAATDVHCRSEGGERWGEGAGWSVTEEEEIQVTSPLPLTTALVTLCTSCEPNVLNTQSVCLNFFCVRVYALVLHTC